MICGQLRKRKDVEESETIVIWRELAVLYTILLFLYTFLYCRFMLDMLE